MSAGGMGAGLDQARWLAVFADHTGATFRDEAAAEVTLVGSVFLRPIRGPREVWLTLAAAAQIYDHLEFTHTATRRDRLYLEWEASALGQDMAGVTVLTVDIDNYFDLIAIHHRPLAAALSFSVELRRRLIASMDPTFFYKSASNEY